MFFNRTAWQNEVISMLVDPNLNSPANIDAAVHLKNDPEGWKKKASRMGIF
jgi:ubiquitin-protein ligase